MPGRGPLGIPSFIWDPIGAFMVIPLTTPWGLFMEFIVFILLMFVTVFMPAVMPPLFAILFMPIVALVFTRFMEEPLEAKVMDILPDTLPAIELAILLGILFKLLTLSFIPSCWLDVGTPVMFILVFWGDCIAPCGLLELANALTIILLWLAMLCGPAVMVLLPAMDWGVFLA